MLWIVTRRQSDGMSRRSEKLAAGKKWRSISSRLKLKVQSCFAGNFDAAAPLQHTGDEFELN